MKKNNINNIESRIILVVVIIFTIFMFTMGSKSPEKINTIFPIAAMSVFVIAMCAAFGVEIAKHLRGKNLKENGFCLYATVQRIDVFIDHESSAGMKQDKYIIYCSYKDESTQTIYNFRSYSLREDPRQKYPVGSKIGVYVTPDDYSKYYVDPESEAPDTGRDFT